MSMKHVVLIVLILQTVTNVLLVRRARHYKCSIPVIVACQEVLKLLTCLVVLAYNEGLKSSLQQVRDHVIKDWTTTIKVGVPAILYVIQNQLLFLSLANLDAATYQVTYQLKILTTAAFSIFLLGRYISRMQWFALFLLTVGVVLVQWRDKDSTGADTSLGFICIILACCTSGFAGVFFEMMLKRSNQSIWIKNIQLASCSCVVSLTNVLLTQRHHITQHGVFYDFAPVVLAVIVSQAYGGLLIGLVMKYADNIMKVFATSISIIISSCISILYFNELSLSLMFVAGTLLVCLSTVLYATYPVKPKSQ